MIDRSSEALNYLVMCFVSQRRSSADSHQRPGISPHAALHHYLQVCTGKTLTLSHFLCSADLLQDLIPDGY